MTKIGHRFASAGQFDIGLDALQAIQSRPIVTQM